MVKGSSRKIFSNIIQCRNIDTKVYAILARKQFGSDQQCDFLHILLDLSFIQTTDFLFYAPNYLFYRNIPKIRYIYIE